MRIKINCGKTGYFEKKYIDFSYWKYFFTTPIARNAESNWCISKSKNKCHLSVYFICANFLVKLTLEIRITWLRNKLLKNSNIHVLTKLLLSYSSSPASFICLQLPSTVTIYILLECLAILH